MLYLDKCWGYLQELTWPEGVEEPRDMSRAGSGLIYMIG